MSLPWLKDRKQGSGLITSMRKSDGSLKMDLGGDVPAEEGGDPALEAVAGDLIEAIKSGDKSAVANALKSLYDICSSQQSEPSADDESFDAMNQQAAE